jgi:hypothetical protein
MCFVCHLCRVLWNRLNLLNDIRTDLAEANSKVSGSNLCRQSHGLHYSATNCFSNGVPRAVIGPRLNLLLEISGSHGGCYENGSLLG